MKGVTDWKKMVDFSKLIIKKPSQGWPDLAFM